MAKEGKEKLFADRLTDGEIKTNQDVVAFMETQRLSTSDVDIMEVMMEKFMGILNKSTSFNGRHDSLILGGSLSKGTAVKNQTDADIIIFKKPPTKVTDPKEMVRLTSKMKREAIKELNELFAKENGLDKEAWEEEGKIVQEQELTVGSGAAERPRVKMTVRPHIPSLGMEDLLDDFDDFDVIDHKIAMHFNRSNKYMLTIEMTSVDGSLVMPFDILPVFDWETQFPTIKAMEDYFSKLQFPGLVSSNFAPLHTEYLQAKTSSIGSDEDEVKLLIMLAKYWFKRDVRRKFHGAKFPSYAIELVGLAVAVNHAEETQEMALADLFMKFLYVVEHHHEQIRLVASPLDIHHGRPSERPRFHDATNRLVGSMRPQRPPRYPNSTDVLTLPVYETNDIPPRILFQRPLIVDPANRHRNVASTASWSELGAAARETFRHMRPLNRPLWDELRTGRWSLRHEDVVVEEILQGEVVADTVKICLY